MAAASRVLASTLGSPAPQDGGLATRLLAPTRLGHALGLPLARDPVLAFWERLARAPAILYDMPPYPLALAGHVAVGIFGFILATALYAYAAYRLLVPRVPPGSSTSSTSKNNNSNNSNSKNTNNNGSAKAAASRPLRIALAAPLMFSLFFWPAFTGRSGVMMLDFWRPALGFRSALLAWDIFALRPVDEVHSWSFPRFFAQLWAFPVEQQELDERERAEGRRRNPRWECLKVYPMVAVQFFIVFFALLYFVPTHDAIKTMPRLSYHLYSYLLGYDVLFVLACLGDGMLNALGLLLGVEMAPMFGSVLEATSIQRFWSTWNKAITVILHRVIFAGAAGAPKKTSSQASRSSLTTDTEPDEATKSSANGTRPGINGLRMTPAQPAVEPTPHHHHHHHHEKHAPSINNKPFWKKAAAAQAAFMVSGIFHEHITYFTFGTATMENFAFFALNGLAAIAAAWFKRSYPSINGRIPVWLAHLLLHSFLILVAPLFCAPFIRSHFFNQLASFRSEILPVAPADPRGSFVPIFS